MDTTIHGESFSAWKIYVRNSSEKGNTGAKADLERQMNEE
jgi:hypothetical protein